MRWIVVVDLGGRHEVREVQAQGRLAAIAHVLATLARDLRGEQDPAFVDVMAVPA